MSGGARPRGEDAGPAVGGDARASGLDAWLAAAPQPQRAGLRALLALARRPRGARLLARDARVQQLAYGVRAMERYEDPALAATLGWDADAVAARGRALRRAEGRP